jgi:hypothetical protein
MSANIISVRESRTMSLLGHMVCKVDAYRVSVGKPEGNFPLVKTQA